MIEFKYTCISCGDTRDNNSMDSFSCECGGHYKLNNGEVGWNKDFLPYYDETLKMEVTSPGQRDREFRKAGLYVSQDDKKMMKRWADHRKYKEDIAQETFKRDGKHYKPGRGLEWNDQHQDFVRGKSTYTRKYF